MIKTAAVAAAGILVGLGGGCQKVPTTEALIATTLAEAGENAGELRALLDRYNDSRRRAAEYLVAGMSGRGARSGPAIDSIEALYRELPGPYDWEFDSAQLARGRHFAALQLTPRNDAASLTASYLAENIDDAWRMWTSRPWNRDLPEELFLEMLLPYRVGDERPTSWRLPYRRALAALDDTLAACSTTVDAARIIASHIGACHYNDRLTTPHRSALDLLESPVGFCREDCDRTLYAMRAEGVPVAIDRLLVSPENGASHMWMVVWDNVDRRTRMFDNERYLPTRDSLHNDQRRKGKVYRSTFAPDRQRLARYADAQNPPAMLTNPWLKDVTAEYFGPNTATTEVWGDPADVYLGVFAGRGFKPVDIARRRGSKAVFTDIEPELIYAPVTSEGDVCGYPFLLGRNGAVHSFAADGRSLERVTLTRKYPVRFHLKERFASTVGVRVQTGPTPRGPWTDLDSITAPPRHSFRRIASTALRGPYLRLYKPSGTTARLSMLVASRDTLGLDCLPLEVVGDRDAHFRYDAITKENYSFRLEPGATDCVVRLGAPESVGALFLLPHNDDNFVVPGQTYELLWFAGPEGWKSAGRKVADGFSIDFDAPRGALLWLRNLTKGREEQIFIWRDGRQLFNIDLGEQ